MAQTCLECWSVETRSWVRPLAQCVQGKRLPGLPGTDSPAGSGVGAHVCTWAGGVMRAHTYPLWGWEQHSGDEDRGPDKDPQVKNLRIPTNMDPSFRGIPFCLKMQMCAQPLRSAPVWLAVETVSVINSPAGLCLFAWQISSYHLES